MNARVFRCCSRVAVVIAAWGLIPLAASSAYGATIGVTMSVSPDSTTSDPGWANTFYLAYTNNNGPVTVGSTNVITNFGSFATDVFNVNPPNPNVSPTFTMQVVPTVGTQSTTLTFYGTITNPSSNVFDVNFSSSSTGSGVTSFYDGQTYSVESFGGYTFGVVNSIPVNAAGKTTNLSAFVGPTQAPEPVPAATTAVAMAVLLGFLLRRRTLAAGK